MTTENPSPEPERDADRTLTYQGTVIRQRGQWLNLSDMWRAAGRPRNQHPGAWFATEEAKRFRAYARWRWPASGRRSKPAVNHNAGKAPEKDHLVVTFGKHPGETWAHWQLALAYGRYLSPAFHAWCNTVCRNAIERSDELAADGDAVMGYVEREFDRLHQG